VTEPDPFQLQRFVDAQEPVFEAALGELRAGSKTSHWMWFVFPQLRALGRSSTAQYYGLVSIDEARAYLAHPILAPRLTQCVEALLPWAGRRSPQDIMGEIDAVKLRSSLTLFDVVALGGLFAEGLEALYGGVRDERTLALLNGSA
jgi:uncharacterized protein (DUF1810 family)